MSAARSAALSPRIKTRTGGRATEEGTLVEDEAVLITGSSGDEASRGLDHRPACPAKRLETRPTKHRFPVRAAHLACARQGFGTDHPQRTPGSPGPEFRSMHH